MACRWHGNYLDFCGAKVLAPGLGVKAMMQLPLLASGFHPLGQQTPQEDTCEGEQQVPSASRVLLTSLHIGAHLLPAVA